MKENAKDRRRVRALIRLKENQKWTEKELKKLRKDIKDLEEGNTFREDMVDAAEKLSERLEKIPKEVSVLEERTKHVPKELWDFYAA